MEIYRPINIEKVKKAISLSSESSSIYLGADSQRFRDKKSKKFKIALVIAIVIHYNSNSGGKIFKEIIVEEDYTGSLRMRLMKEVEHIARIGAEIVEVVGPRNFEIHLDVNPNPKEGSNIVLREAIGWIKGQFGIEPKVKPEAVASSTIADKFAVTNARYYNLKGKRNARKASKAAKKASKRVSKEKEAANA